MQKQNLDRIPLFLHILLVFLPGLSVFSNFCLVSAIFAYFSSIFACFLAIIQQFLPNFNTGRTVWHNSMEHQLGRTELENLAPPERISFWQNRIKFWQKEIVAPPPGTRLREGAQAAQPSSRRAVLMSGRRRCGPSPRRACARSCCRAPGRGWARRMCWFCDADVDGLRIVVLQEDHEPRHQVRNVLEGPGRVFFHTHNTGRHVPEEKPRFSMYQEFIEIYWRWQNSIDNFPQPTAGGRIQIWNIFSLPLPIVSLELQPSTLDNSVFETLIRVDTLIISLLRKY